MGDVGAMIVCQRALPCQKIGASRFLPKSRCYQSRSVNFLEVLAHVGQ
jgi:hypothetical protein